MPSRKESSSSEYIQQQLEAAQARITELETQLRAEQTSIEAQKTIKRYGQRMEILHQIDLGIINANSTEEIIATALKHIRQLIPCQRANVTLIDTSKQEGIFFAVDYDKETAIGKGFRVPLPSYFFEGYDDRLVKSVPDLRVLQHMHPSFRQAVNEGLLSGINFLLMDHEKTIGTLGLFADKTSFFTAEHQEIIIEVGNQLAIAIRQYQLTEALTHHAAELEQKVNERTLELQAGKAQVEAILNNSSNGILLINTDLSIQQSNASFHNMFGCKPDECHNNSLLSLIHKADRDSVANLVAKVMEDRIGQRTEVRVIRKDETSFDAELAVELITGDGLVCTIQDITERKAYERQLRYYGSMQQSVSDAVIATDMNFLIQSWNAAAERIYGWTAAEALGHHVVEILQTVYASEEDRQRIIKEFIAAGSWQREMIQRSKDGRTLYIHTSSNLFRDDKGQPIGIVSVNRDVTERKQEAEALQKSAAEIHDLYNNAPCGYHSLDKHGVVIQINDTELKWLGYSRDEVVGKLKIIDLYTPESVETFQKNFPIFKERGWIKDLEFDVIRKDGSIMHILLNSTAIYDEHGEYLQSRSIMFDITELRKAQLEISRRENYYRALASNLPLTSVFLFDSNFRYLVVEGPDPFYPAPYMEGKTLQEIFSSETVSQILPGYEAALRGETTTVERASNGRIFEGKFVPVFNTDRTVSNGMLVVRDVTEDRSAAAVLRASEARYRLLAENIDDIIMSFTMDRVITYMSPSCERLLGYLPEEVEGKTHSEFIHPEDYPQVTDRTRQAIVSKANAYTNQFRLRHKDGQYSWYEVRTRITGDPNNDTVVQFISVLRDISERKQAEDALRESESRYRLLTENITDVIAKNDPNGIRTFVSSSVYSLLGYRPEELIGLSAIDIVHPDDRQDGLIILSQTINSGDSTFTLTQRVCHKDGHYVWIEVKGHIVRDITTNQPLEVIGVIRDITERRQAEAAMRESEAEYRSLIETMHDGLAILDKEFHVTYVNERFCEMLDYPREAIIGKLPTNFVDPDIAPLIQSHLGRRYDGESTSYELPLRRRDGKPINVLFSGTPLFDKEGQPKGSFVITTDITVQKQAQDALRQALAKEKELGDLKTRFISIASHEFRTPLATILATVETLTAYRDRLSNEQIDQRFEKMKEQIGHLKNIMDDMLMLSRMQARRFDFNPINMDLDKLIRTILDEFQSLPDITHRLEYAAGSTIPQVPLDPKLMRQIISNLLSNAIKYSDAGKLIQVSLDYSDQQMILKICDQGIGIPEADLPHLFEPFHRAVNAGQISGTGLGLVIIKEAAELHQATIAVESKEGQGATFIVRIPIPSTIKNDTGDNPHA